MNAAGISLLRHLRQHDRDKVEMVELFFDLVFVFAVTQLSHSLLSDLTLAGVLQVGVMLLAVWWVWIYTSWVTNWLDPQRAPVRACLFVLMLAGLVLSASIPRAFADRGLAFAGAYVFMQLGRTLFFIWAVRGESLTLRRTFLRIFLWFAFASVFWLIGGYAPEQDRLAWWTLALAIDLVSPAIYYWVPGLGRSTTAEWNIEGGHLAERCALFVIIALGESLLITGATFAGLHWDDSTLWAFAASVVGSILMWWIYFDTGAERAHHRIAHSTDPGRQGRSAYTYLHVLIVAGIVVCAVADEILLVHPGHATDMGLAVIIGGPICYLLGTAWFKWLTNDRRAPPLSHLVGLGMLALLLWPAFLHVVTPLQLSALTTAVLAMVAVWESVALRRR
jgi:low temperature requirement protein LtrA